MNILDTALHIATRAADIMVLWFDIERVAVRHNSDLSQPRHESMVA